MPLSLLMHIHHSLKISDLYNDVYAVEREFFTSKKNVTFLDKNLSNSSFPSSKSAKDSEKLDPVALHLDLNHLIPAIIFQKQAV